MRLHWRSEGEVKRLPRAIQEYMQRRFTLLPEYLELLRCFVYMGQVNGKQVSRVSIFSPNKAREKKTLIKNIKDLEQHPELLLYEGYIDGEGNAYVADRRSPIIKAKSTQVAKQ